MTDEGTVLGGNFRLERGLSAGGEGSVYLATQLSTGFSRAVKVLHRRAEEAGTRDAGRFRDLEFARELSRRCEHFVQVIDAGNDGGVLWLAMELLDGCTLEKYVSDRGRLTPAESSEVFRQLGIALKVAHDAHVVHRDIKPANIFISKTATSGRPFTVKLLDFGIGKRAPVEGAAATKDQIGTPLYMAPEQAQGESIFYQTDVWALALLAYFVLTGHDYAGSEPEVAQLRAGRRKDPSAVASARGVRLPAGFDAWFHRGLALEPFERFDDGQTAVNALLAVLQGGDQPPGDDELATAFGRIAGERRRLVGVARARFSTPPSGDFPLLTGAGWIPDTPLALDAVSLCWTQDVAPVPHPTAKFLRDGETYADVVRRIQRETELFNGYCYRLLSVDATEDGAPRLVFGPADYFGFLNTCSVLALELSVWCGRNPGVRASEVLPLRGQPERAVDLRWRNAVPGVNTLLIVKNHPAIGGSVFYMHERLGTLAEAPNSLHVIPAGTFQPDSELDAFHDRDFSLRRTVLRELAEELLGLGEVRATNRTGRDFLQDPGLDWLSSAETSGALRLFYLGIGLDPLTTKPEILTSMVLDGKRIPPEVLRRFEHSTEGRSLVVPLTAVNLARFERFSSPDPLPACSAALALARIHLGLLVEGV